LVEDVTTTTQQGDREQARQQPQQKIEGHEHSIERPSKR